ncbi:guanylate kinase [Flavobacterium sp. HJSW_4]|uniref:guanylate kinase n=1 Tax=Flavobacterium sp. HJSW_4 TaxID=3344660 RepID=UPI0035F47968
MVRNDLFAKHMEVDCRFWKTDKFYVLQTDYHIELLDKGFKRYDEINLKDKVYKEVTFDAIESAADVSTFCTYKGLKFFVENTSNRKYTLRPLEEAMSYFKDFPKHGYDPMYEIQENEIEEIWEERKPIEEFIFDAEPIVFLKKNKV